MKEDENKDVEVNQNVGEVKENTEKTSKKEAKKKAKAEKVSKKEAKNKEVKEKKVKEKTPKSGKKKALFIILPIVSALIIAAIVVVAILLNSKKDVDLSECMKVVYEGFNGYATAEVKIDTGKLGDKIGEDKAKSFAKKAKLDVSNTKNLSNGDEIEIKIDISSSFLEENKIDLKSKKVKIKAQGIKEPENIDLSKYVSLKYEGFNKHATAKVEISEELEKDKGEDIYRAIKNSAKFTIKNDGELENDKDAEITVEVPDTTLAMKGAKVEKKEFTIKVSDLKEAKEVDAFANVKVNVSGMSPNVMLSVTNESTDDFVKTVRFTLSKTSGIANGETVTITATSWDKNMAKEKGYVLKSTTMEYKVENVASYVSKTSEITADVKAQIKKSFAEKAKSKAEDQNTQIYYNTDYKYSNIRDVLGYSYLSNLKQDLTVGEPEVVSMYLLTKKTDVSSNATNKVIAIVRIPYTSALTKTTYNWYATVIASNFSLTNDGKISENAVYKIEYNDGDNEEKAYSEYVNSEKRYFDVESIALN